MPGTKRPSGKPAATAGTPASVMQAFLERPGLYVHIPFCSSICPFCPYNKVLYETDLVSRYFVALQRELDGYLSVTEAPFASLYIGGGTPTLCLDQLEGLLERLPVTGERAIEVLPNHATPERVRQLQRLGINYISLGIQSFDAAMLQHLGRPNTVEDNHHALQASLGNFDCVDVDLIFDVAFQDEAVFLRDMQSCFSAGVDQVSSYPLMRFGYTPFGKARHYPHREHAALHKAEALARRYGYERRSVWTFNRRETAPYTSITREFYLGIGASAASYSGRHFQLNHFSISRYIDRIMQGELPVARRVEMGYMKAAAYYLFWQAYTGKVDPGRMNRLFPGQHALKGLLALLRLAGLMQAHEGSLQLTGRGYNSYHNLERRVTYRFIEPLWNDMMHEHDHLRGRLPELDGTQRLWLKLTGLQGRGS